MTLEAYHKAINQGFSESEACRIADEAFEQYQADQAQYAAEAEAQYAAEAEAQYAAEAEAQARAELEPTESDAALAAERGRVSVKQCGMLRNGVCKNGHALRFNKPVSSADCKICWNYVKPDKRAERGE